MVYGASIPDVFSGIVFDMWNCRDYQIGDLYNTEMITYVQIALKDKEGMGMTILESEFVSQDAKYLYLTSGRYLKSRIVWQQSRIEEEGNEEEEDDDE